MTLTFTDIFCGAGGSSIGLTAAGLELKLAANHWRTAIDTHAANFPHAEHLCADINNYDMRGLPSTDVLWASPICTEASPAGGSAKGRPKKAKVRPRGQLDMFEQGGHVEQAGFTRTRATFGDVIRATEVRRYKFVVVENVPDVTWRWELFDWWCQGMCLLGYDMQAISGSSAHFGEDGNDAAPQWRDRIYLVFSRKDIPRPDVTLRPVAWCAPCGTDVRAVQWWKNTAKTRQRKFGKYGRNGQYLYLCPNATCRNAIVEPYVRPASTVIDWTDLGDRIGDRDPADLLAPKTVARIEQGLKLFAGQRSLITVNHSDGDARALPIDYAPLPTRTVKVGEGVLTPPLLVPAGGSWNDTAYPANRPFRTRTATESEALLTPESFIAVLRNHADAHRLDEPLRTMAAGGGHHALVVPYRRANRPTTTDHPLHTMATRDSGALVQPAPAVQDCRFRMLKPREQLRSQRFPDAYRVTGNIAEQTMQAGNAVSANVAQWIGRRLIAAADSRSAS